MLEPRTTRTLHDAIRTAHEERARAFRGTWSWLFGSSR